MLQTRQIHHKSHRPRNALRSSFSTKHPEHYCPDLLSSYILIFELAARTKCTPRTAALTGSACAAAQHMLFTRAHHPDSQCHLRRLEWQVPPTTRVQMCSSAFWRDVGPQSCPLARARHNAAASVVAHGQMRSDMSLHDQGPLLYNLGRARFDRQLQQIALGQRVQRHVRAQPRTLTLQSGQGAP